MSGKSTELDVLIVVLPRCCWDAYIGRPSRGLKLSTVPIFVAPRKCILNGFMLDSRYPQKLVGFFKLNFRYYIAQCLVVCWRSVCHFLKRTKIFEINEKFERKIYLKKIPKIHFETNLWKYFEAFWRLKKNLCELWPNHLCIESPLCVRSKSK